MKFKKWIILAGVLTVFGAGCGDDNSPPANNPPASDDGNDDGAGSAALVRTGVWGGQRFTLTVQDEQSLFRNGCFSGRIDGRIPTEEDGDFNVEGSLRFNASSDVGGPVDMEARYSGRVSGDTMTLTVAPIFGDTGTDTGTGTNTGNALSIDPSPQSDTLTFGFEGPIPGPCIITDPDTDDETTSP